MRHSLPRLVTSMVKREGLGTGLPSSPGKRITKPCETLSRRPFEVEDHNVI
jgi:hypothetical protein